MTWTSAWSGGQCSSPDTWTHSIMQSECLCVVHLTHTKWQQLTESINICEDFVCVSYSRGVQRCLSISWLASGREGHRCCSLNTAGSKVKFRQSEKAQKESGHV
jgi:hypothetical protein